MFKALFDTEKKQRRRSRDALALALESGKPASYLYSHYEEWNKILADDFIEFIRSQAPITLTSYELADIFERYGHINTLDVSRYIRNKLAENENESA